MNSSSGSGDPSLFQDDAVSWVRIVNDVDRYVTESMPTAKEEDTTTGKPVASQEMWTLPNLKLGVEKM